MVPLHLRRLLSVLLAAAVSLAGCGPAREARPVPPGPPAGSKAPPTQPDEDPILVQFRKADGLLANGDARQSADLLLDLAAAAPDRWYIWNTLSLAYRRLDFLPAAAGAGIRANSLKPGDPTVAFNTGVALTMADRAAEAVPLLRMAGTSADALYWLAVAQVAATPGGALEARQTLRSLLERYPDDAESKVALAALDLDLDLDSKPDAIEMTSGRLTVRLTGGQPFDLKWNPLDAPTPTAYQVVDAGAPYPVLLLWSAQSAWVYMYRPGDRALRLVKQVNGPGVWRFGTKVLGVARVDKAAGTSAAEDWGWRQGEWKLIRQYTVGLKDDRPVAAPKTPLDLGAFLAEYPVRSLFADDATWDGYVARWRKAVAGQPAPCVFLLPRGGGWEAEIWSDGRVLDSFRVDVDRRDGTYVIEALR